MIPDDKIQEIIDKTDIVELVGEYVDLTKRGKNYMGLCPFHDDHTPSFSVSVEKKIAKCMTCKEGGNPITFLRKIKNISFDQAARELAKRYNVTLEGSYEEFDNKNYHYYKIMNEASKFYQDYLFNTQDGKEALKYLYNRGLSDELIKKFHIGLAPKEKDSLYRYLTTLNYSLLDLEDLGLVSHNNDYNHDVFINRITFPIIDANNNTLGFSARIYYQSDTEPRYINTGDTKIFNKGLALYNLNNAVREVRLKKYIILCEGQMDVIALTKYNFPNVVCSLGTALTKEQVSLIKSMTKNVIILYDGDKAGLEATKKAFELLKGTKTYSIVLPNGQDPDEFLKANGEDALKKLIKESVKSRYDFLFEMAFYQKDPNDIYQKDEIKKGVFAFLKEEKEMAVIETYLKKLGELLGLSYEAIFNDYNLNLKTKNVEVEEKKDVEEVKKPLSHELMYLALIIFEKKYYDYFNEKLDDISLYTDNQLLLDVYFCVSYFYNNEGENTSRLIGYINQEIENENVRFIYDKITELSEADDNTKDLYAADIVKRFHEVKYRLDLNKFKVTKNMTTQETIDNLNKKIEVARKEKERRNLNGISR